MAMSLADRLSRKILTPDDPERDCWIWVGAKNKAGYGIIRRGSKREKFYQAHRASYELNVGPIAPGMSLLHTCGVKACVNPLHLRPATQLENMADRTWTKESPMGIPIEIRRAHCDCGSRMYKTPSGLFACERYGSGGEPCGKLVRRPHRYVQVEFPVMVPIGFGVVRNVSKKFRIVIGDKQLVRRVEDGSLVVLGEISEGKPRLVRVYNDAKRLDPFEGSIKHQASELISRHKLTRKVTSNRARLQPGECIVWKDGRAWVATPIRDEEK